MHLIDLTKLSLSPQHTRTLFDACTTNTVKYYYCQLHTFASFPDPSHLSRGRLQTHERFCAAAARRALGASTGSPAPSPSRILHLDTGSPPNRCVRHGRADSCARVRECVEAQRGCRMTCRLQQDTSTRLNMQRGGEGRGGCAGGAANTCLRETRTSHAVGLAKERLRASSE